LQERAKSVLAALLLPRVLLRLAAADLNRDGKLDLVVATTSNGATGAIQIFLGKGDGTFQNPTSLSTI
jgi:FG-GAP-like repeat